VRLVAIVVLVLSLVRVDATKRTWMWMDWVSGPAWPLWPSAGTTALANIQTLVLAGTFEQKCSGGLAIA